MWKMYVMWIFPKRWKMWKFSPISLIALPSPISTSLFMNSAEVTRESSFPTKTKTYLLEMMSQTFLGVNKEIFEMKYIEIYSKYIFSRWYRKRSKVSTKKYSKANPERELLKRAQLLLSWRWLTDYILRYIYQDQEQKRSLGIKSAWKGRPGWLLYLPPDRLRDGLAGSTLLHLLLCWLIWFTRSRCRLPQTQSSSRRLVSYSTIKHYNSNILF